MSGKSPRVNVLIYVANGRLGRMVAAALRARGARLRLSGRSRERVKTAAKEGDEVSDDARGVDVVVNCAPTDRAATDALIATAVAAGAHYADAAGEQALVRHVLDVHARAGVAVIPALGFDYAVGDCLAAVAARGLEPCAEVTVAYAFGGRQAGANSVAFASAGPRGHEVVYRNGQWHPAGLALDFGTFDFPQPFGRQRVGRYGAGEVVTVPRHVRTRRVRAYIAASALVPHPALVPLFPLVRPLAALAVRTPLRHVVGMVGGLLARVGSTREPDSPTVGSTAGPDSAAGAATGPSFVVVAEARALDGRVARATATGPNCHAATAEILALGAQFLANGEIKGALSAAAAFPPDKLLDALTTVLTWSLESP